MNCVSSIDLSLKYKRFTPLGWQDISIRKFEFVTKTQFLYQRNKELGYCLNLLRKPKIVQTSNVIFLKI